MPLTELVHYCNDRNRERYGDLCRDDAVYVAGGRVRARLQCSLGQLTLESAFQPIANSRDGKLAGHEALIRAVHADGRGFSADELFAPLSDAEVVFVDRLCRTVHVLNFLLQGDARQDLYLNLHPRHVLAVSNDHGLVFEEIIRRCGLAPQQLILEMRDGAQLDWRQREIAIHNFRHRGYRVAVDNFGRDRGDIERLRDLDVDLVKLDASLLQPDADARLQRAVELAQDLGALTVAEGIESAAQLALARRCGVDRLQGFLLGTPQAVCHPHQAPLFAAAH